MRTTYETETRISEWRRIPGQEGESEDGLLENLKLGHDIRFILVVVGGGAVRVGQAIARRHLRYVETIAINCDPRVQYQDEFDRRVYLGPEDGFASDTHGSAQLGAQLARAAVPSLERLFEGAAFVTVVASLGGGAGTGALPVVLEAAARSCEVVSAFVIRPFECEGERRALADRTVARLNFLGSWVEKQQRGVASLQILDNERLARSDPSLPFNRVNDHWAEVIASHIEKAFLLPAEAAVEAGRLAQMGEPDLTPRVPSFSGSLSESPATASVPEPPLPPLAPTATPVLRPDAELTFEIDLVPRGTGSA